MDIAGALSLLDGIIQRARAEGSLRIGVVARRGSGIPSGGWLALLHAQSGAADALVANYATLGRADVNTAAVALSRTSSFLESHSLG